jgi:hypothetical protein
MASDSGKPNRKLLGDYRALLQKRGYDTKILITTVLGEGALVPHKEQIEQALDYGNKTLSLINEIRPKLAAPFRDRSDTELAATGIFLISRKPQKAQKAQKID